METVICESVKRRPMKSVERFHFHSFHTLLLKPLPQTSPIGRSICVNYYFLPLCVSQSVNSGEPFKWPLDHFSVNLWATISKWENGNRPPNRSVLLDSQYNGRVIRARHCTSTRCSYALPYERISVWTTITLELNVASRVYHIPCFNCICSRTHTERDACLVDYNFIFSNLFFI